MNLPILYEYLIYAAIIAAGIVILILLRRVSKLPTHRKLNEQLRAHQQNMEQTLETLRGGENKKTLRFFKTVSKLLYATDKLIHSSSALARKERDTDIDNVSVLLEKVRNNLLPYKYGKKEKDDLAGMEQALRELRGAVAVMQSVLARDDLLKARSAK